MRACVPAERLRCDRHIAIPDDWPRTFAPFTVSPSLIHTRGTVVLACSRQPSSSAARRVRGGTSSPEPARLPADAAGEHVRHDVRERVPALRGRLEAGAGPRRTTGRSSAPTTLARVASAEFAEAVVGGPATIFVQLFTSRPRVDAAHRRLAGEAAAERDGARV